MIWYLKPEVIPLTDDIGILVVRKQKTTDDDIAVEVGDGDSADVVPEV
jgi:hypothetical protein